MKIQAEFNAGLAEQARKRRAKLLKEFNRLGWTITKFAKKHDLTPSRMKQLLDRAKADEAAAAEVEISGWEWKE